MLPVADHLELLAAQTLVSAKRPGHASHEVVNLPSGPRRMKETLSSKVGHRVAPHLVDNIVPAAAYKETIDKIHTEIVAESIARSADNRVLGAPAPKIDPSETSLSRPTCATLAQLRSGHCAKLRDLQLRFGTSDSDTCPECRLFSDSVDHLFNCPAHPTNLSPIDMWTRPEKSRNIFLVTPPLATFRLLCLFLLLAEDNGDAHLPNPLLRPLESADMASRRHQFG